MKRWKAAGSELKKLSFGMSVYRGLVLLLVMTVALARVYGLSAELIVGLALVMVGAGGLFTVSLRFSNVNIPAFENNPDMATVLWALYGLFVVIIGVIAGGLWLVVR